MTIDELINHAGGVSALARAAGCDHSSIYGWRETGRVPISRVRRLARRLRLPLCELRPDVWPPKSRPEHAPPSRSREQADTAFT